MISELRTAARTAGPAPHRPAGITPTLMPRTATSVGDHVTLSEHRPVVGGAEAGEVKLNKRIIAGAVLATVGSLAVTTVFWGLVMYFTSKWAAHSAIKKAVNEGLIGVQPQKQPVVIVSNPQRGSSTQGAS